MGATWKSKRISNNNGSNKLKVVIRSYHDPLLRMVVFLEDILKRLIKIFDLAIELCTSELFIMAFDNKQLLKTFWSKYCCSIMTHSSLLLMLLFALDSNEIITKSL